MSEGTLDRNDQLQEPSGTDAYAIESLREKVLHRIEDLQDAATLRKVWSLLSEMPSEQKPLELSRHTELIFNEYNETLSKLAK
jgi:hypothetical protein